MADVDKIRFYQNFANRDRKAIYEYALESSKRIRQDYLNQSAHKSSQED